MKTAEEMERAERLAFPECALLKLPTTPEKVWAEAAGLVARLEVHGNKRLVLALAVYALALLDDVGVQRLGAWAASIEGGRAVLFTRGSSDLGTYTYARRQTHWEWASVVPPGAYLDGSADELTLLTAASDELQRRKFLQAQEFIRKVEP